MCMTVCVSDLPLIHETRKVQIRALPSGFFELFVSSQANACPNEPDPGATVLIIWAVVPPHQTEKAVAGVRVRRTQVSDLMVARLPWLCAGALVVTAAASQGAV